jgi:predicted component of type VI protein secretion system
MGSEKAQKTTTFLVVRDGVKPDWVAIWDTVEITVGRHESQDIAVREAEVSRKHCVFRQKGGVYTLEDLGSALGTSVNGEPIKVHELKSGDVIAVGPLRIKFGQTASPVKPGSNVRFASQLKGFNVPGAPATAEGGRTMMAIDLNDSMRGTPPTLPKAPRTRAVSLDGRLEDADVPDLSGADLGLGGAADVRDLDASLADFDDGLGPAAQPLATPAPRPSASAPRAPIPSPHAATLPRAAVSGDVRVSLVLEVAGPAAQVEALLAAVRDKPIQVYPITLCVKDPRQS